MNDSITVYILRTRERNGIVDEPGWKIVACATDFDALKARYDRQPDWPGWDIIELEVPTEPKTIFGGRESLLCGKGWEGYVQ